MKRNREQDNINLELENDTNVEQNDINLENKNEEVKEKKYFLRYVWRITKCILIMTPICFIIYYNFFMPHYQKRMLINLMPFTLIEEKENQQLVNVINKEKIVELPTKKAQNLAAFLEEFDQFEIFQQNPTYGNLLEILNEIQLRTKLENKFFPSLIARNYEEYINKKLFEDSLIENSNSDEINIEEENEEQTTITEVEE